MWMMSICFHMYLKLSIRQRHLFYDILWYGDKLLHMLLKYYQEVSKKYLFLNITDITNSICLTQNKLIYYSRNWTITLAQIKSWNRTYFRTDGIVDSLPSFCFTMKNLIEKFLPLHFTKDEHNQNLCGFWYTYEIQSERLKRLLNAIINFVSGCNYSIFIFYYFWIILSIFKCVIYICSITN